MTYNPEDYWHKRGADYQASGEALEAIEVENLKKLISQFAGFDTLFLEIGSGYGRLYKTLGETTHLCSYPEHYWMCDFVQSMRYNCLRNTNVLPDYWDGKILPYSDKQFDFIISFSVLLHVLPCDIENIITEHVRICRKHFFIATYAGGLDKLAEHCFEHDYKSLFEKYGLKIISEKLFQKGLRVNWLLEI